MVFDDDRMVLAGLDTGATGFTVKDATPEAIIATVRVARLGAVVLDTGFHRASAPERSTDWFGAARMMRAGEG